MSISQELERLHQLYTSGGLSAAEYDQAKAKVISSSKPSSQQQQLAELEHAWLHERERYAIGTRHGRTLPTGQYTALVIGLCIVVIGGLYYLQTQDQLGDASISMQIFLLTALLPSAMGLRVYIKHRSYKRAEEDYRQRRRQLGG